MDYHIIGFRECASEVARYLVTIEGMDIQDPLRLRLMSHLQCFVAQRELSAKSSAASGSSSNWSSFQSTYQPNYSTQAYQAYPGTTPQQQQNNQSFNSSSYMSNSGSSSTYLNSSATPQSPEYTTSGYGTANSTASSAVNTSTTVNASSTSPKPNQAPIGEQQHSDVAQPIYTDLSNSNDRLLNLGGSYNHHYGNANQLYGNGSFNNNNNFGNNNNSKERYRPWQPEIAY